MAAVMAAGSCASDVDEVREGSGVPIRLDR